MPLERVRELLPYLLADVTVALLWGDLDDAADLEAVDGPRRDAGGLCELDDGQLGQGPGCS